MKVFLVVHHEIMGTPDNCRVDEMVFYTCTSLKRALGLIKKSRVDRWSWWEIQSQELNRLDWPEHLGLYGPRGGELAKPPFDKCVELYKRKHAVEQQNAAGQK